MRKIDGRKAEITEPGRRFPHYTEFADIYGYPDAAYNIRSESPDMRQSLQKGDIVTLLVSGNHDSLYKGDTLWIVEAANGERHIYNEKGLRILSEELSGVTILKDESLGGIEREYREVKRKARVGERIKVTYANHEWKGGPVTVVFIDHEGDPSWKTEDSNILYYVKPDWYVVLEPTDIIRIDGERLRMVDRKAAVGERIIIVKATAVSEHEYTNGNSGVVTGAMWPKAGAVNAKINGNEKHVWREEYRVLEPVESAKSAASTAPLSAQPPLDQAAANISALTAKVQALESRVATLEAANQPVKVAEGPADDAPPSFAFCAHTPQQLRDEIVERAKADVKALLDRNYWSGYSPTIWFTDKDGSSITDKCDFIVNRDKRTVVALISEIDGRTFRKGIAKCAPNDVFNAHIGRAIALRRALGLEVPAEYLSVPNPEEPRVGDVVDEVGGLNRKGRVVREMRPRGFGLADEGLTFEGYCWAFIRDCKIIDDSREEVGA